MGAVGVSGVGVRYGLVALGSAYYHWSPNSETLVWDRLPMTAVFMSLFATTIGERVSMTAGRWCLWPLLAVGVGSVVYWKFFGDLRWYAVVQFYPMIAMPVLLVLRPPRYTMSWGLYAVLGFYVLAKMLELFDHELLGVSAAGGHPWKHVASAAALVCYMIMILRRERGEL